MIVLIATTGRDNFLRRTLNSIAECILPNSFSKVIVVENGRKGNTESLLSEFVSKLPLQYEYVNRPNKGNALNYALAKLSNSLVLFTDDDVRFHTYTLTTYAEESRNAKRGVFYGGRVEIDYEKEPEQWLKPYLTPSSRGWKAPQERPKYYLGCNWAAYVDDIKNAGLFNPLSWVKHHVAEETDMQIRLMEKGLKSKYLHNAIIWHFVPKNRCSPLWALRRAYINGYFGDSMKTDMNEFNLSSYPKWAHYHLFQKNPKPVWKRIVSLNRSKIFGKIYWLTLNFGYLQGRRNYSQHKNSNG